MLVVRPIVFLLMVVMALTSCSTGAVFHFYVVIKPNETARFIGAVRTIAKDNGLETAVGRAPSDNGGVLTVAEGRGHGLMLWVQNVTLTGHEDSTLCGVHSEPYPDPAQFLVFTAPRFFGTKTAAIELGKRVFSRIQQLGFDVRREPVLCGAAALHDHS